MRVSEKDIHAGHRQRLRERFRTQGLSGFAEHEALELLLTYAIPQKTSTPSRMRCSIASARWQPCWRPTRAS